MTLRSSFFEEIIFLYFVINSANFLISISISLIPKAVNFCNLSSKIASTCRLEIEYVPFIFFDSIKVIIF